MKIHSFIHRWVKNFKYMCLVSLSLWLFLWFLICEMD